jgi:hypothetical protein
LSLTLLNINNCPCPGTQDIVLTRVVPDECAGKRKWCGVSTCGITLCFYHYSEAFNPGAFALWKGANPTWADHFCGWIGFANCGNIPCGSNPTGLRPILRNSSSVPPSWSGDFCNPLYTNFPDCANYATPELFCANTSSIIFHF